MIALAGSHAIPPDGAGKPGKSLHRPAPPSSRGTSGPLRADRDRLGPAGEKGAAQAAYFGKRVALIEREPHPGGAGINTGTVPSKTLRETARYFSGLGQHALYGVDYHVKTDLTVKDLMYREQEVVRSLRQVITENIGRHGIDYVQGHATFTDPHTLRVTAEGRPERMLQADVVLIATGSVPHPAP